MKEDLDVTMREIIRETLPSPMEHLGNPLIFIEIETLEYMSTSEKYPELSFYKKGEDEKFVLWESEDGRKFIFEHYIFD